MSIRRGRGAAWWGVAALLLSALARPAWCETWHVPDRPEVTVRLPDGAGWQHLPPKLLDPDGLLRVAVGRLDETQMVGVVMRTGLWPGPMKESDVDFLEHDALEGGMTMVDSARFVLDGNRAIRIVTRGSIDGRNTTRAQVAVMAGGCLYMTEALATDGNPFEIPELAGFLLSLRLPPGDGSARMVPAPGFSVVLPVAGEDWIVETGGAVPKVMMVKAVDHHGAISLIKGDGAGPAGVDQAMMDALDREMYGPGEFRKTSGRLVFLPSGDPAYFTVGTGEINGVQVTLAQTYTVANGHLFGVQAAAHGNPLLDPVFNRALFSLSTE